MKYFLLLLCSVYKWKMPLDNESSEFRSGAISPYDDDNPLVVIPSDLKTNVKDLEPKSASPCNSEPSVLRVPAPAISGTKMSSIREGVIQRQKPIARYSPTLNVTIGNVSVSLVGVIFMVSCSLVIYLCCLQFGSSNIIQRILSNPGHSCLRESLLVVAQP